MGRAPCCDKTKVKRGPWSPEEDNTLMNYIHKNGSAGGSWIALPNKAGLKRCGKSCRLRWLNYLRPDIKHGCFTEEEDHIILTLYHNIGSRWSVIASHLPGRTDNDVKNHWNTKLKKKLSAPPTISTSLFFTTTTTSDNIDTIYGMNSNYSVNHTNNSSYFPVRAETETPLPRLKEVPEIVSYTNPGLFAAETSSSQEVVTTSLSPDDNASAATWSADTFLGEMDIGLMSYDLINGFDFEGNITDEMSQYVSTFLANDSDNNEQQQLPCPQSLRY